MKKIFRQMLLLPAIATIAAFAWMPPAQHALRPERFAPEAVEAFTLTASDLTAPKDSQVCIEVKTGDFNKILSMQYSMNWDAKVLKFREVRNFGLTGMTKNNFGAHLTEKGILTFSWYDPNLRGMTKNGEVILYEVCFDVTGEPGSKTQFTFNGNPTVVEITNAAGVLFDLKTAGGQIEVK